jgi:hypothetical protein
MRRIKEAARGRAGSQPLARDLAARVSSVTDEIPSVNLLDSKLLDPGERLFARGQVAWMSVTTATGALIASPPREPA